MRVVSFGTSSIRFTEAGAIRQGTELAVTRFGSGENQADQLMMKENRYAVIVGGLAVAVRLSHLIMLGNDPVADVLMLDSWSYDRLAHQIVNGELPKKVFFQAPLYPYFLAFFYRFFNNSIDSVRIAQMLLDSVSAVLIFRITKRLFSFRAAAAAGFAMALYPVMIFQSALILKTTLNVFFAVVMLWLIFDPPPVKDQIRIALLGLISGWASATQGSVLLQLPLIGLWLIIESGWKQPGRWISRMLWFGIGLTVGIGPFTLRNYLVSGRFVLLTSQGGANFYLGNSPYSDGTSKRPPRVRMTPEYEEADFHLEAERTLGRSLTPEEAGKYWRDAALKWIRENPRDAAKLQVRKFSLFWNRVEIPDNYDFDFYRRYSWMIRYPRFPFWVAGSLGLAGMLFLFQTWRKTWFLYLWAISYCLIWVMFHIYSRYRLPMAAFLLPFAGAFAEKMAGCLKKGCLRRLTLYAVVMIGILYFQSLPLTGYSHAQPLFNLGSGLTRLGKHNEARNAYMEALRILPDYEPAMVNLGKLEWAEGNSREAVRWWEQALRKNPNAVEALSNLGSYFAMQGRMPEARDHFAAAVREQPYYFLGWLHLAQAEESLRHYDRALKCYDQSLILKQSDPQAMYGRAKALDALGDPDGALDAWKRYREVAGGMEKERIYVQEAEQRIEYLSDAVAILKNSK